MSRGMVVDFAVHQPDRGVFAERQGQQSKSLKPVYDGLQKIKFEKPRAKYKAEHEAELKQFYAARRKLTGEVPDGKVDMKKLTEEYDELEQVHEEVFTDYKIENGKITFTMPACSVVMFRVK